jgi:nucleoside-diphosphate-sugar epimerase
MKILVTGATGKVGSRFVPRLLQLGHSVYILIRDNKKAELLKNLGAEVVIGDLSQPSSLPNAVENKDAVVHLAAFFRGATDQQAKEVNLDGAVAIANAALKAKVKRFVFASTSNIYGQGHDRPASENDPVQPIHAYPATKLAAEKALQELCAQQKMELSIFRLAFVYGESDPHIPETFPYLSQWHPAKRLHMVHHADVGQALLRGLTGNVTGVFNVADDAPITIGELRRFYHQSDPSDIDDSKLVNPWEGILSTLRIRDLLGFRPIYPSFYSARDAGVL